MKLYLVEIVDVDESLSRDCNWTVAISKPAAIFSSEEKAMAWIGERGHLLREGVDFDYDEILHGVKCVHSSAYPYYRVSEYEMDEE